MSKGADHGRRTTTDDFLNVVATRARNKGSYRNVVRVVRVVRTPALAAARAKPSRPKMIDRAAPRANARAPVRQHSCCLKAGVKKKRDQPYGPENRNTTSKPAQRTTLRSEEPSRCAMPEPSDARPETLSPPRRVKPWRAAWSAERKFQGRPVDCRGDRGASLVALARSRFRTNGIIEMTENNLQQIAPPVELPRKPPVRVKVRLQPPQRGKMYPPDGERKRWWDELKLALGTASSSFVNVSLLQLQSAARLPDGPLSEVTMNAALAMIEAAAPQNEVEGALAVQLACTHCAAMYVLSRVNGCTQRSISAYSAAAAKLLRAYTLQIETLRRLRSGGAQHVRVEHVHINDQARAMFGPVSITAEASQEIA